MTAPLERMADPVFVVGSHRSGTTLLRLMLMHHSQLAGFDEFEFAMRHATDAGWPAAAEFRRKLELDWMFRLAELTLDPTLDSPALVDSLVAQLRAREGDAPIFGCVVHTRFDKLVDHWPDAKYVHVVRDPRDVARSCIGMGWYGHVYSAVEHWIRCEQRWDALRSRLSSGQYLELRYEDLVLDPPAELSRICRFLGVDFEPAMLSYSENSTYDAPDPKLIAQWKRKLGERDLRLVEGRLGARLGQRGYEPSGLTPIVPNFLQRRWLGWLNRRGRFSFGVRRYGLRLYLERIVSRRVGWSRWQRSVVERSEKIILHVLK